MKTIRVLAPILAVMVLLAMTGAHALFGRAQVAPVGQPIQSAQPVQDAPAVLPSSAPPAGSPVPSAETPGSTPTGDAGSGTSNPEGSSGDAPKVSGAYDVDGAAGVLDGRTITANSTGQSGVLVQNGGSLALTNARVTTTGARSAALQVGVGGGSITTDKAALSTSGGDSPLIASGGNVTATSLTGSATASPIAVIEAGHSVTLTDSDLSGAGGSGVTFLGAGPESDSTGAAAFSASNCKLTTSAGPFFSVTGTRVEATLTGSTLTFSSGILAQVSGNLEDRRDETADGGRLALNAVGQVLSGDVSVDGVSSFQLSLEDGSIYTGAVDNQNKGRSMAVTLDDNSSWTLTADSHVDAFTDAIADLSNLQSGGFKLYYDAANPASAWLNGRMIALPGGGFLTPEP